MCISMESRVVGYMRELSDWCCAFQPLAGRKVLGNLENWDLPSAWPSRIINSTLVQKVQESASACGKFDAEGGFCQLQMKERAHQLHKKREVLKEEIARLAKNQENLNSQ